MIRAIARYAVHATRDLPPPHPSCRTYDLGGVVVLMRNHDRASELSRTFHDSGFPTGCRKADSPEQTGTYSDPPAWDDTADADGRELSYAEMAGGY